MRGCGRAVVFCTLAATLSLTLGELRGQAPPAVEPLKAEAPAKNAGVFIGINEFSKDLGLQPLEFAVNDATALAYVTVVELRLIPPKNCFVCLSGDPTKDHQAQLDELKRLGAKITRTASKADILVAIGEMQKTVDETSLITVAISSHGLLGPDDVPYVVPADGVRSDLEDTALKLNTLERKLEDTHAAHRLMLIDACQERVSLKSLGKSAEASMKSAFAKALEKKTGQIKVASCRPGEFSYEDRVAQQGAFTSALLRALRTTAAPRNDNVVDLEAVLEATKVVLSSRPERERQTLFVHGEEAARKMPLAVRSSDSKQLLQALQLKVAESEDGFNQAAFTSATAALAGLKDDAKADQAFLRATRDFAAGRLSEFAYVAVLERFSRARMPALSASYVPPPISVGTKAGEPREFTDLKIAFRWCPQGQFLMGSPDSDVNAQDDEKPPLKVTLSRGFWLGQTEVTQAEWKSVMGTTPWSGNQYVKEGQNIPATVISHGLAADGSVEKDSATEFCRKLTTREQQAGRLPQGWSYRLPTEAEWEYACRAGTTTRYSFGNDAAKLGEFAWFDGNTWDFDEKYAHRIGQKTPNPWGLCDMHGGVHEFCQDWYSPKLAGGKDPRGPSEGTFRIYRGGSWVNPNYQSRCAFRGKCFPSIRNGGQGFRIALSGAAE